MKRSTVFKIQIAWLAVLAALAALYFSDVSVLSIQLQDALGPIPIGVLWFGALGAVVISLNGIIEHTHDWDPSYDLWHLSRPVMGAGLSVVGVLMLQAGIMAVGAQVTGTGASKNLLYYLVAFLIGYREETFRELMKRLVDLVLAPAAEKVRPTITKVEPSKAMPSGKVPVVITGAGLSGATSVLFNARAAEFHVASDASVTAEMPDSEPAGDVAVVVKTSTGAATSSFKYAA